MQLRFKFIARFVRGESLVWRLLIF